jgi:hypothetical protein
MSPYDLLVIVIDISKTMKWRMKDALHKGWRMDSSLTFCDKTMGVVMVHKLFSYAPCINNENCLMHLLDCYSYHFILVNALHKRMKDGFEFDFLW